MYGYSKLKNLLQELFSDTIVKIHAHHWPVELKIIITDDFFNDGFLNVLRALADKFNKNVLYQLSISINNNLLNYVK